MSQPQVGAHVVGGIALALIAAILANIILITGGQTAQTI